MSAARNEEIAVRGHGVLSKESLIDADYQMNPNLRSHVPNRAHRRDVCGVEGAGFQRDRILQARLQYLVH